MTQMLWQLKNLKTGEALNEPQLLPQDWGPIFGMHGFKEKLHDLSWIAMPDLGWFEVAPLSKKHIIDAEILVKNQIEHILNETNKFVAVDNFKVSRQERTEWIEYRKQIKEIPHQVGFPLEVFWPTRPDSK